jgi:hypothetical protein
LRNKTILTGVYCLSGVLRSINMSKSKTILAVLAHPDDETFGLGGTLALYARQGVDVYYVCATRGEAGAADEEHLKGTGMPPRCGPMS